MACRTRNLQAQNRYHRRRHRRRRRCRRPSRRRRRCRPSRRRTSRRRPRLGHAGSRLVGGVSGHRQIKYTPQLCNDQRTRFTGTNVHTNQT